MDQTFAPVAGVAEAVAPDLLRVLAPNPSAMTGWGTNSYILGAERAVVIDPGPDDAAHLAALMRALDGRGVSHIVVTHAHADHAPLARPLARLTAAPVCAFGGPLAGRSAVMRALVAAGYDGGGEGVDTAFAPDVTLADGAVLETPAGPLRVMHTPGHMGNHICLGWRDAAFSGDLVMGWTTSLISPPDGDVADFIASCGRLRDLDARVLFPGHGAPVTDPAARIDWLLAHRADRRAQVLAALDVPRDVAGLTAAVYTDVSPALWPIAARNVFAQLVALVGEGVVQAVPALSPEAAFSRVAD